MSDIQPIEFRTIERFPGYRIGSDGSVWTCLLRKGPSPSGLGGGYIVGETWRQLKPLVNHNRHAVDLTNRVRRPVHRLVLEAFVGPCPPGMECCHEDGNPTNNRLDNLRWDTKKANMADAIRHGTKPRGEKHGLAKLDAESVVSIRTEFLHGEAKASIAKKFGVSWKTIHNIVTRKIWKHVP